ncbi:bifunctional 3-(3-hydroxy-phenyl)propionate/3-hydroxycinnamic acid hydroxylase [Pararhodobacter oceanensis]|uniref:bifunctional 3-(3-hydroxy-phenyl)propionate/3-hydroxycinnamic acid hydroxylase n=1 Tax=Pararhodobacter oceanensis TaxID=2172121 RepID=UPI003A8CF877
MTQTAKSGLPERADIVIIGAGPVGLTIANYLGQLGISVLILEQRAELIDYPRGVGMDDETLRSFQSIGLADAVASHTVPDQKMRFIAMDGRTLATIAPKTRVFGWPRRNSFIQPMIDRILFDGLARFPSASVEMGTELTGFEQCADGVHLQVTKDGVAHRIATDWLIGCDGGRSIVRKSLGIGFEGITDSTRWVVVDLLNDPVGRPDSRLYCEPARPFVSIALPHGMRRLEFMVLGDETEEDLTSPEGLRGLLGRAMPRPDDAEVLRSRVYTHNARLATAFRKDRVLLAGDAAHLMPVWQGQGYNSGIRDATNLAWKLAMVVRGMARPEMLDSYEAERRDHARAMIDLSVTAGRVFSPTSRIVGWLRDKLAIAMNVLPPIKRYFVEMRYKPMPRYTSGIVLHDTSGTPRGNATGKMFPQPMVTRRSGETCRFDDVAGTGFALISWATDPQMFLPAPERARWQALGARFLCVVPDTQRESYRGTLQDGTEVIGDATGELHDWFSDQFNDGNYVFLRPDRFVAGIVPPQDAAAASTQVLGLLHATD